MLVLRKRRSGEVRRIASFRLPKIVLSLTPQQRLAEAPVDEVSRIRFTWVDSG